MAEPKASFTQMFLMAVKLSIGAGALALPATLHACGVVEAIVLFLCMGGAVRWCMHAMLRAKDYCASRGVRVDAYPDLGSELIGGEVGRRGIEVSIVGFQLGVCCVYLEFARGAAERRTLVQMANALSEPKRADELVRSAVTAVLAVYVVTAFLGGYAFDKPRNPLTLSVLDHEPGPPAVAVNVLVCVAVVLTYPLQFYPAIVALERIAGVGPGARAPHGKRARRRPSGGGPDESDDADGGFPAVAFRLFFVAGTALVAVLVSDLTRLINLVGIIFAPMLAFIFPALCDLVAAHRSPDDYKREPWELAVSACILVGASAASFVGTAQRVVAFLRAGADGRVGDHVSGEYAALCSECHVFGHHAHKLVREAVAQGAAPSRRDWARTLDDHRARTAGWRPTPRTRPRPCSATGSSRAATARVADALWDLVDGADGDGDDSTIASAAAVADALCAFDSHAFRNGARGPVEILVIDGAVGRACAPEEEDAAFDGADSLARKFLAPGGREKGATFPTSKAPSSVVFHSVRLTFGRATIP
ncbi:amino acid transmembrane transporter [Aureococcus anophagefferens]|uniref:Amino acid transmembrane transporter n=1 Tax=Aureococcus anophagefferens TaxID=44056 RepID=A0ABR1FQK7_AURAN